MECRDLSVLLSTDVDGELSAAEAAVVHDHLQSCPGCSRRRAALKATRGAVRAMAAAPAQPRRVAWLLLAASAVAAVLALALFRTPAPPPPPVSYSTAGVDCGIRGRVTCIVDAPCRDGACAAPQKIVPGALLASE